jgi:hypothetical protein
VLLRREKKKGGFKCALVDVYWLAAWIEQLQYHMPNMLIPMPIAIGPYFSA